MPKAGRPLDPGVGSALYDLYANEISQVNPLTHVVGRRGVVATTQPLASSVGLDILRHGGNAIDAAVAVAATLAVIEPYMSGPLGLGFMTLWRGGEARAVVLDFSGAAPRALDVTRVTEPLQLIDGGLSVAVPEGIAGWWAAWQRYGSMPWATLFEPAIEYANNGFPVAAKACQELRRFLPRLRRLDPSAASSFLVGDRPAEPGELVRLPALAATFRHIAAEGPDALYRGALTDAVLAGLGEHGSPISRRDLEEVKARWVEPLSLHYRGAQILVPPPPSAGMQLLETLGILAGFDLASADEVTRLHLIVEATKLAVTDRVGHDPELPADGLLAPEHLERRRGLLDVLRARAHPGDRFAPPEGAPDRGEPAVGSGHTTHFSIVDRDGNGVSCTLTLGHGFGAGIALAGTGLFVNNMNWWFDLDPRSPNHLGPSRRFDDPMSPTLVAQDNRLRFVVGTPGGNGIPQTTTQVLVNLLDRRLGTQASVEAPRVLTFGERPYLDPFGRRFSPYLIATETRLEPATLDGLRGRGHEILPLGPWSTLAGTFSVVRVLKDALEAGVDRRQDNHAVSY